MSLTGISSLSASSTIASTDPQTSGTSRVGLEAQLDRYKKQLSDCENCASASTPEGKTQIQNLQARIDQTEVRLKAFDTPSETTPPNSPASAIDTYA